jgi:ABC-type nitrate/sulfonate/bicarbonate transport system substrate-binding protein
MTPAATTLKRTIAVAFALLGLHLSTALAQSVDVTLDWLPSPEYYGFYYAQRAGLYERQGLQVSFRNASGAPVVAAQLGAGSIRIGTTTSDNILRQAAQGVRFSHLVPIILFNPVTIVSLPNKPVNKVSDLRSLTLGTNPQTSTYAQYEYLLRLNRMPLGVIREYPIGYGGAVQLLAREVDAFLAYTTNQAVDVEIRDPNVIELLFEENGLRTYGLVLAIVAPGGDLTEEIANRFVTATLEGYRAGGTRIDEAVDALAKAEPTLNREKVTRAIKKIVRQNAVAPARVPPDLDQWVALPAGKSDTRSGLLPLYQIGISKWPSN